MNIFSISKKKTSYRNIVQRIGDTRILAYYWGGYFVTSFLGGNYQPHKRRYIGRPTVMTKDIKPINTSFIILEELMVMNRTKLMMMMNFLSYFSRHPSIHLLSFFFFTFATKRFLFRFSFLLLIAGYRLSSITFIYFLYYNCYFLLL